MALDELHARRLSTVITVTEDVLARIELALDQVGKSQHATKRLTPARIQALRREIASMRRVLDKAVERFDLRMSKPEPQQVLAAELSSLWVVLENALPKRLKGYGREWEPAEKADWEKTVQTLLHAVEELRAQLLNQSSVER
ncbi:MAG: hypothetical protein DMG21_13780 [Acidobacteria bacterium]|nr:MAG: hypothetical protein DMG21_13780 [Acidobacteriota bacterium]